MLTENSEEDALIGTFKKFYGEDFDRKKMLLQPKPKDENFES